MTARSDANRKRWAVRLGFSAAVMGALAFAVVARDAAGRRVEVVRGAVAPRWSGELAAARTLEVTTAEETLTVVLGEDGSWTLRERGDHPVNPAAIAALGRSLADMTFSGARTSDPANHERLGVLDPAEGGAGVRLTVRDATGEALEDWIFGEARTDGVFLRRPDEAQTYAASGAPPDLASPAFWLDLDFLRLQREDIAAARIEPEGGGQAYALERGAAATSDFRLVEPARGYELITAGAANGPGAAIAGLRFADLRRAGPQEPASAGVHVARTADGLEIALAVVKDADGDWARLAAEAVDPADAAAVERAAQLNARTEGWLYKLPPYAADRLVRPLSGIARPAGEPR